MVLQIKPCDVAARLQRSKLWKNESGLSCHSLGVTMAK